jgi:hypothetical protein
MQIGSVGIILAYEKRKYIQLFFILQRVMVHLCHGSSEQLWDCQHAKQLNSYRRRGNLIGGLQQLK